LLVSDFDFDLPPGRIALRPAEPRDTARLLVLDRAGGMQDKRVSDLPSLLRRGDLMVFNDTKVLPARLSGLRGAAKVEMTLHKRLGDDLWAAFAKPAKKLAIGDRVVIASGLAAQVEAKGEAGEVVLRFDRNGEALLAALETYGVMPLPPYIAGKRKPDARDLADYQTLFAEKTGAVAAPTAGLHFTPRLMDMIEAAGIATTRVTLHVGAGTFLPVKSETVEGHKMHAEWGDIGDAAALAIARTRAAGGRIVAVGTTSARLLESAALTTGEVRPWSGETDIFIRPGFRFRIVDVLMTNFHLPRSTLMMLVSAFAGLERVKHAYAHAIGAGYRFYSYGDACLIERAAK